MMTAFFIGRLAAIGSIDLIFTSAPRSLAPYRRAATRSDAPQSSGTLPGHKRMCPAPVYSMATLQSAAAAPERVYAKFTQEIAIFLRFD
jgi:hypothetical protein